MSCYVCESIFSCVFSARHFAFYGMCILLNYKSHFLIKTMTGSLFGNVQQESTYFLEKKEKKMAQGHQGKCFGFVLLLCFFSSTFARRILKDLPMMEHTKLHLNHEVKPGMVSLSQQDHELLNVEPDPKAKPDHKLQSEWGLPPEPEEPDHVVKPNEKEKQDHIVKPVRAVKPDDKEKQDHIVKPVHAVKPNEKEKQDLMVKPVHAVKPNEKEKQDLMVKLVHVVMPDDKEKQDHIVKPVLKEKPDHRVQTMASGLEDSDHAVKPMGFGEGRGYGSGNGVGYGIGYGSGGSGFGEGIGSGGGGSGFGEGIGSGGGSGVGIGEGIGSGSGQPNCGPVTGAPGSGFGEGIGQGSGSGQGIGIGIGRGSSGGPSVVVPGTTIPPIVVPGTQIPGFVIPGVTVPGYGSGCQTGGCTPNAPYYHPPSYQPCPHCPPFTSGQDKHMSGKGPMTEALAPTSNEMHG
ncbi:unnamed protein product [Thlaspi arvense]|uniref:Uncharacterized protein n=1 Tax=Thlaspi arvense TaxID=13288 RepID=A0AAU9RWV7_THLAR|nr:unnamed protein product [Thlaspi arvense]